MASVELVCLVNNNVVIIGFSLCSSDNVISTFRSALVSQAARIRQFRSFNITLTNMLEIITTSTDRMLIPQSRCISSGVRP